MIVVALSASDLFVISRRKKSPESDKEIESARELRLSFYPEIT